MATAFQDYYATLGVPRTAGAKEIKAAFRKLARKHHPDLNQADLSAERRFKEVNEANEVLSDPEKRKRYDELGSRWREYEAWEKAGKPGPDPFGGPMGGRRRGGGGPQVEYRTVSPDELESMFGEQEPFSDFFYSMFGAGGATPAPSRRRAAVARKGQDVEAEAEVTLEEADTGTTRTVELSGAAGSRRVEIQIPAGVAGGARVRAAGQGATGSGGGGAGDLMVRVRVRPHPRFTRHGDDLHVRVAVPVDVALLGGEVAVPTLRGTTAQLQLASPTQNGARLRLRGLGMTRLRGGGRGDLIVDIDVRMPPVVGAAARELAAELRSERETPAPA